MKETELERLVVRLVGDSSSYQAMVQKAVQETQSYASKIENKVGQAQNAFARGQKAMNSALSNSERYFEKAAAGAVKYASAIDVAGRSMTSIGRSMSVGVTLPLTGLATAAVYASTTLNREMANVQSLGVAQERVEDLKGSVQDMAIATGKSTTDLAGGLYQVVSAFGDTSDTAKILDINARAAAAGLATTTDAINLTSAVTKGYGDTSAAAVEKASDLAFTAVKLGQTTFPELAASIGKVIPLTNALGVSQEELFAVMATATGVTGNAAEVSTQLRGVMQGLMVPTADFNKLLEKNGFASGKAMLAQLGLQGTLKALVDEAQRTGQPLANYMASIEGQTLALAMSGSQSDVYAAKLKEMGIATGATNKAFKDQKEGINLAGATMDQVAVKVQVMMEKLGDGLAPILMKILDLLSPLVDWLIKLVDTFAEASPWVQTLVISFGALLAALGPILAILGPIVSAVGLTIAAFGAKATAVAMLTASVLGLKVAIFALQAGLIGLVAYGVVKLVNYLSGATASYKSLNDEMLRNKDLTGQINQRIQNQTQKTVEEANSQGSAEDRQSILKKKIDESREAIFGFEAGVNRQRKAVDELSTNWNLAWGNKNLAVEQQELESQESTLKELKNQYAAYMEELKKPVESAAVEVVQELSIEQKKAMAETEKLMEEAKGFADSVTTTPLEKHIKMLTALKTLKDSGDISSDVYDRAVTKVDTEFNAEGLAVTEEMRTPLEKYNAEVSRLTGLLMTGAITYDTYNRAAKKADEIYKDSDAFKKHNELLEKGKQLTEQYLSPAEKFLKTQKELGELKEGKYIDEKTYKKAMEEAQQELNKSKVTVKLGIDASEAGSAESLARVQSFFDANRLTKFDEALQIQEPKGLETQAIAHNIDEKIKTQVEVEQKKAITTDKPNDKQGEILNALNALVAMGETLLERDEIDLKPLRS